MPKLTRLNIFGIRLATVVLAVYWIALFTGTHMPSPPSVGRVNDKAQHFIAFFVLAVLLYWVIPAHRRPLRKVAIVMLVAISYAAFDEWSQRFSPQRTVDIRDFFSNALGITAATIAYLGSRAMWLRYLKTGDSTSTPRR
jgi:VanZ family protein